MDDRTMSGSQRFFARILGREGAAAMEAESRAWLLVCPHCGYKHSVWDGGGVRYKSAGSGFQGSTCPNCGRSSLHRLEKGPNFPTSTGPSWPLVRAIVGLVLGIWLVVALIVLLVFMLVGLI